MGWQVGDLALCVCDTPNPTFGKKSLQRGRIYTVEEVSGMRPHSLFGKSTGLGILGLRSASPSGRYAAARFRKVTPRQADTFDREVIAALNSEPVHARNNDAVHNSCQREGFACPDLGQVGSAG